MSFLKLQFLRLHGFKVFTGIILACALTGFSQNITLVGTSKPPTNGFGDVWGEDNLACLGIWSGYGAYGVGIFDISNPAAPNLIQTYSPSPSSVKNRFEQGVIRSKIAYIGSWGGNGNGGGLHILSLTNVSSTTPPVLLSKITKNGAGTVTNGFDDVHTLFLERSFLYEAAHNAGSVTVKVFEVSNPSRPVYLWDIVTTNTTKVHQ
ncbi:MAG: hypothetical protein ACR2H1_09900, partial [Limisphaerales bacterium]